jgi:hypothetical protein
LNVAIDNPAGDSLLLDILVTLERIGAPYMIVGAFAAIIYGTQRTTFDIDIVADLTDAHVRALAATYLPPRFYADADQMRDSIRHGTLFNIVDTTRGEKADLVPLSLDVAARRAFQRRVRQVVDIPGRAPIPVWCASPEDVIVGKLAAWDEGRSRKHEADILQMLVFPENSLDTTYITGEARRLSDDARNLWAQLQRQAQDGPGRQS